MVSLVRELEGVAWTSVEGVGGLIQAGMCEQPGRVPEDAHASDQYWLDTINLRDAWARIEGEQLTAITVAVIDSGVNYNHPELVNNMWVNPDEIAQNAVDDDLNGIIDDIHGAAFISMPFVLEPCDLTFSTCAWDAVLCASCQPGTGDPQDAVQDVSQTFLGNQTCVDYTATGDGQHGTACAAIIASAANEKAIRGFSCNINIMAIRLFARCFDDYPFTESSYIDGIQYAAGEGASVISNSVQLLSGTGLALQNAIKNVAYQDIVFVIGAGNEAANVDDPNHPNAANVFPPQRFNGDHVLHVGASDLQDDAAAFSNWGASTVDLFAPGVDIRVYDNTGVFPYSGFVSGTSFSTPMVSGAVAVYRSLNPSVSAADVVARVKQTSRPVPALNSLCESGGILNVDALIAP